MMSKSMSVTRTLFESPPYVVSSTQKFSGFTSA
jgi:hypothetical protein